MDKSEQNEEVSPQLHSCRCDENLVASAGWWIFDLVLSAMTMIPGNEIILRRTMNKWKYSVVDYDHETAKFIFLFRSLHVGRTMVSCWQTRTWRWRMVELSSVISPKKIPFSLLFHSHSFSILHWVRWHIAYTNLWKMHLNMWIFEADFACLVIFLTAWSPGSLSARSVLFLVL